MHVHALEDRHFDQLVELFRSTWWARDRDRPTTELLIQRSDLVHGVVDASTRELVAFARVLTDGTTVGLVLDVVVDPSKRGRGIGTELLSALMDRPPLPDVRSVELVCQPDVVAFYERLGFTTDVAGSRLMRRTNNTLLVSGAITTATADTPRSRMRPQGSGRSHPGVGKASSSTGGPRRSP